MSRKVFLNGNYIEEDKAKISIFDRGVLFADSVYEVTAFKDNKLLDFIAHLERLRRSLKEINIHYNIIDNEFIAIHKQLIKINNLENKEGLVYLQISRGNAERDFLISKAKMKPNIFAFTQEKIISNDPKLEKGLSIISVEDLRWKRRDIKSTQLLYPSLVKTEAIKNGADVIWVSNHGGRMLESCYSSLKALVEINKNMKKKVPIFFDSGIRSGSDVIKAIGLGADIVGIGRPVIYSLILAGNKGVSHMLELLREEIETAMINSGSATINDISKKNIKLNF